MKKILFVNDYLLNCHTEKSGNFGGGVELLLNQYLMEFKSRYECDVLIINPYVKDISGLMIDDVNYFYYLHETRLNKILDKVFQYDKDGKLIEKKKSLGYYDVIVAMKEGEISYYSIFLNGGTYLSFNHTDYLAHYYTEINYGSKDKEFEHMKKYNHIICVSNQVKDSFIKVIGDTNNLVVRNNPIKKDSIINLSNKKCEYVLDKNKVNFVMLGNIVYQKGYDLLYEACLKLDGEKLNDKYDVYIAGRLGKEDLMNKLYSLNNIRFLGFLENPYPLLKNADYFLSTSRYEGKSISLQEALILKIPPVVTRCSGVSELVNDNGVIMNIDSQSIYENMKYLISNRDIRYKYLNNINDNICDYQDCIDQIEALF